MNYKEKVEALRAFFSAAEEPVKDIEVKEEVELAEEPMNEPVAEEEAPAPAEYVTLAQFNELKENTKEFMESVTEMLSSAMEMINSTEKNKVPVEASKQEEEVELAVEPVTHNPEEVVSNNQVKVKINGGAARTAEDRAFETWVNSINKN